MLKLMRGSIALVLVLSVNGPAALAADAKQARAIHEQVLFLDTHLDIPIHFARPG